MSRTFGVEIEMFSETLDRNAVTNALQQAGVNCQVGRYGDPHASYWVMKTDGSIRGRGYTMELVSPCGSSALRGDSGLLELKKVGEVLVGLGMKVNRSCGFHVHVGASDLSVTDVKKIVERYSAFEHIIDNIMPPSRRGANNATYLNTLRNGCASRILSASATSLQTLASHQGSRYYKVNVCAFPVHGTVEFRHHGGTVDPEKMQMWVRFLLSFIEQSRSLVNNTVVQTPPVSAGSEPRLPKTRAIAALIREGQSAREIASHLNLRQANVFYHSTVLIRDYGVVMSRLRTRDGDVQFRIHRWFGEVATPTSPANPSAPNTDNPFDGCPQDVVEFYRRRTARMMTAAVA